MKTAKPPQAEAVPPPSSRRAQPVRQTRTNPARSSGLGRALNGPDTAGHEQPIDIFPGITHFTDAITSLPKDLVRHFTLLKEVDAKIFAPEETLFQLVDAALKSNPPEARAPTNDGAASTAPASALTGAQNSSTGLWAAANGTLPQPPTDENYNAAVYDPAHVPRRHLFRQTAFKIQEMLVALEEKNHVMSTANEALSKQLGRIDNIWPHLEQEFSDEAKNGSTTHWAYPENRAQRANAAEQTRRNGAPAIPAPAAAAAQQSAEDAAARSEARKQAVAAKKGLKNHHQDSDAEAPEQDNGKQQKNEPAKKQNNGSKSRKATEANAPVGLGITPAPPASSNPPSKKRKVDNSKEKQTNGGQIMERAMSGVYGNAASKPKNASPRGTPAPEAAPPPKKRKALPTVNGQSKKSKTGPAAAPSPAMNSPPVQPVFADPKVIGRNSPAPPATTARPASSRARQNSTLSNLDRQRPTSSAASRPNGIIAPLESHAQNGSRPATETKPVKEPPPPPPVKTEAVKEDPPQPQPTAVPTATTGGSRKNSVAKVDDAEPRTESVVHAQPTITTVVTTKSGRASKPSTPALGSFPDHVVKRSSRNAQAGTTKRSHKKGAAQAALAAQAANDGDVNSAHGDEDGEIDANEPRYCYCNGVSYGEMVACDADDCEKEWFHLGCVGLKSAPSSSTKWYCDNCKNRMKNGKKVNGR